MPLQFGLLTGKFDDAASFAPNDHRKGRLTDAIIQGVAKELKPVWELCEKYNVNKAQLALSYLLSYPEISVIIPGIRTVGHVTANTTGLVHLDKEDLVKIEKLGANELLPVMELIQKQG
jgi:aryl-alcohol dehydrogenase-like predicted oxidoreductase